MLELATKILAAIFDVVGVEPFVKLIAARTPRDAAIALLDAEYNAARAEADAEAARELRPPPTKKVVP